MIVEKEIKHLLLKHECVIVPGFGAFISHHVPSQIYPSQNQLMPPSKSISFNRLLTNNDGLLNNAIAFSQQVKYNEATQIVDKQVNTWNALLESHNSIVLKEIGKLQKTKDNKIDFISSLTDNICLQSFGLNTIHHLAVERTVLKAAENSAIKTNITKPIVKKQKETRRKSNRSNKAKYVLLACAIAIITLSQLLIFTESPVKVNEANFINFWSSDKSVNASAIKKNHASYNAITLLDDSIHFRNLNEKCKVISSTQKTEEAIIVPESKSLDLTTNSTSSIQNELPSGYYLILGCFKEKNNANRLKEKLIKEGKKVYKATGATDYTTIGEFISASKEEATQEMRKRQVTQPDVWLKKL